MSYETSLVTNAILERAFKEARYDVTPMKLQKLLYFLNGWHLAVTGNPAIGEEFKAWQYGPVVPSVYRYFKGFGKNGINEYMKDFDISTGEFKAYVVPSQQKEFYDILDAVWERYIGYTALTLSAMTHQENSPWDLAIPRL